MAQKAPIPPPEPRLRVGLLVARNFTLSAFASFVDVLRLAADEGDRSRPILCSWRVLSAEMGPVKASCGTAVFPDERLGDPSRFDYIAVIGGLLDERSELGPSETRFLQEAAAANVPLIGICTGTFALLRAGLMEGYRCCVSWFHHQDFLERFDGIVPVSDRIFVVDRDRLTCSGGVSSAHLAAYLVERHVGHAPARKSLQIMIIDEASSPDRPQPAQVADLETDDPLVRRALALMAQEMDSVPTMPRIAERVGTSRRKLERHFNAALGLTPGEAFLHLRLARARQLLETTSRPVAEIAVETGFCDGPHFGRVFRTHEGVTPAAWRRTRGPD